MSWASIWTGKTMDNGRATDRPMDPMMKEEVTVRLLAPLIIGDTRSEAGDQVRLERHRACYLVFLQKAEYV